MMMMMMMMMIIIIIIFFRYSISTSRSFTLALSGVFLYVTYTTAFPLGGPDSCAIRTNPDSCVIRTNPGFLRNPDQPRIPA
jgi:hypothetical protein